MSNWNLPPGVTGNEDYFGPDAEEQHEVVCGASASLTVYTSELGEELDRLLQMVPLTAGLETSVETLRRVALVVDAVRQTVADLPVIDTICPFEGAMDVAVYGRGPLARCEWTCPVCGTERTEYAEDAL
jgi:hypothetical protein